jgi:hypothetical protein
MAKQQTPQIDPTKLYRAKQAFSGDLEVEEIGEDGKKRTTMVPFVGSPGEILQGDHEAVQKWPHHYAPVQPAQIGVPA